MIKATLFVLGVILSLSQGSPIDDGSWRIVGGSDAALGAAPYQIILKASGSFTCGGSIITNRTILTAAHCVSGRNPTSFSVVAGTNFLNSGGSVYNAKSTIVHPEYDAFKISNDVALVIVDQDIVFTENVTFIALGRPDVGAGANVTLTGWGMTSYPVGSVSESLQTIDLKTISYEECKERWGSNNEVIPSQICTLTKSGEGACRGDSGGPLVRSGIQVGVVSWGNPCARGFPDVFSRVSSFESWISDNLV